jgi:hypothetical protein
VEPGVIASVRAEEYNETHSRWNLKIRGIDGCDLGSGGPGDTSLSYADLERNLRIARVCASASAILTDDIQNDMAWHEIGVCLLTLQVQH